MVTPSYGRSRMRPTFPVYWLIGEGEDGAEYLHGWFATQQKADAVGFDVFKGKYQLYELDTIDRQAAKGKIRSMKAEKGSDLSSAMKPIRNA